MRCMKCKGRMFVDKTYTDNKNIEVYCEMCGNRVFVERLSRLGEWLTAREQSL